jgi:hypothetical protein
VLALGPALHRCLELGDDRVDANLFELRVKMRFGLLAHRPDDDARERAKVDEAAALVRR